MTLNKPPKSVAQSMRFVVKEVAPFIKAKAHERKAEALKKAKDKENRSQGDLKSQIGNKKEKKQEKDPSLPHLQFLERMRAMRFLIDENKEQIQKEYLVKLAQNEVQDYEIFGHLLASLSKARLDRIFALKEIGKLNATMLKPSKKIQIVISKNEELKQMGITFALFNSKRRDLKYNLGRQNYKSGQALAFYMIVIEKAASPKIRKEANWVHDEEILSLANFVLREIVTHILADIQFKNDDFLNVGKRKETAEEIRKKRLKGRAVRA